MYSKQEVKNAKRSFWTAFGQYMKPVPSSGGQKVNWINYRTGVADIYFRMDAGKDTASIWIELAHQHVATRHDVFNQFLQLRSMLHGLLGEEWEWEKDAVVEHRTVSRIGTARQGYSLFRQEDWPAIISFLKPRIVALDAFWDQTKEIFEPF